MDPAERPTTRGRRRSLAGLAAAILAIQAALLWQAPSLGIIAGYALLPAALGLLYVAFAPRAALGDADVAPARPGERVLWTRFGCVALALASMLALVGAQEKPFHFYALLSAAYALVFVEIALTEGRSVRYAACALGVLNAGFVLVTTLFYPMYAGSGDTITFRAGVEELVASGSVDALRPFASYHLFPSLLVLAGGLSHTTGLPAATALHAVSAFAFGCLPIVFHFLVARVVESRLAQGCALFLFATSPILLLNAVESKPYAFGLVLFLYSLSILLLPASLHARSGLLTVFAASYVLYHKADPLIAVAFVGASYLAWLATGGRRSRHIEYFVVIAGTCFTLYGIATSYFDQLVLRASAAAAADVAVKGVTYVAEDPVAFVVNLAGFSIALLFLAVGVLALLGGQASARHPRVSLLLAAGAVVAVGIYFPNPLHQTHVFSETVPLLRLAKNFLVLVAIVGGIGLALILSGPRWCRGAAIALVACMALSSLANDFYSRDAPVMRTGTFTNFFDEHDLAALSFSARIDPSPMASDALANSYLWRLNASDALQARITPSSDLAAARASFLLVRADEMERRGLQFEDATVRDADALDALLRDRSRVYDSGSAAWWQPAR